MKQFIFSLFVLVVSITANAQPSEGTFSVIPRLGVNISNQTGYSAEYLLRNGSVGVEDSKAAAGINIGAEAVYQFTDLFFASAGLDYSLQRCKIANYTNYLGQTGSVEQFEGVADQKLKLSYVHLPLMVGCYVYNSLAVKLGLQFGYLASAKETYNTADITIDTSVEPNERSIGNRQGYSVNYKDRMKKLELSIPLGVSYEYENVVLDLRYNWSITKAFKHTNSRNQWAALTVGYRFELY